MTSELLLSRAITSAPAPTATTAPNKIFAGILIAASFLLYACGWILGDSRFDTLISTLEDAANANLAYLLLLSKVILVCHGFNGD